MYLLVEMKITINFIKVIEDGSDSAASGTKLNKWTIVLIVIGCIGLVLIMVLLCIAWWTKTLCFNKRREIHNLRQGRKHQKRKDKENDNVVGVIDTNYVVGQDYKPHKR